jgi:hypothetical protein
VMVDIIQAGLSEDGPELVRGILFSNEASTAGGVLRRRHDVCFSCPREKRCLPVQNVYDPYHVLMEYRYSDLNRLLAKRYPGEAWADCLIRDWMVAKFFIPYTVTVTAKRWMVAIDLLNKASVVLDKSHGKYCPKDDRWVLEASAFPEETNKSWRR